MVKIFLSEWAKVKGRTLASIAQEIGVTAPSLSQIDNGKTWVRAETLEKLGQALGIESAWLLFSPSSDIMQYAQGTQDTQETTQALGAIVCPHCGKPMSIFAK